MTKQKVLAVAGILGISALVLSAGTLAYFTDSDKATNTFTMGNVDIKLIEQQRNEDGTALENFEQNKVLMPLVGSAQDSHKDQWGMTEREYAKNYVDKMVSVKNTGASDAYVRLYVAFPSELDNDDASKNIIHWNFGNYENNGAFASTEGSKWNWLKADGSWNYSRQTIGGVDYNVYITDYIGTLEKEKSTEYAISGFYLDKNVDYANGNYTINGNTINFDFSEGVNVLVKAVAVQSAGFDNADEAVTAAFGANFNPFAE